MRQTMFSYARSRLRSAEILPGLRYHKDGVKIIRELFEESISEDTYYGLVGTDTGDKLLKTDPRGAASAVFSQVRSHYQLRVVPGTS